MSEFQNIEIAVGIAVVTGITIKVDELRLVGQSVVKKLLMKDLLAANGIDDPDGGNILSAETEALQ